MAYLVREANFGLFDMDDPDDMAFCEWLTAASVEKTCVRCKERMYLLPSRIMCAACETAIEYGAPPDMGHYQEGI